MEDLQVVYNTAYFTHVKCGTTTVGEFPLPTDGRGLIAIADAIRATGVSAIIALQTWDQIEEIRTMAKGRPQFMVSLGKEEDFTVYSFESTGRTARELGAPLVAHVAERRADADAVRSNFHKDVVCLLRDYGALKSGTLLVHLNHASVRDLAAVEEAGGTVVVCASSALQKQTGYPSLRHMNALRLCAGTDWGNLDMLAELRFLKHLPMYFQGMPAFTSMQLLRMGTINGARALGCASDRGSIEAGKRADLVFYFLDDLRIPTLVEEPGTVELADLLLASLSSRDVADVMIGGKFLHRRGYLSASTEQDILGAYREVRKRLRSSIAPPQGKARRKTEKLEAPKRGSIPLEISDSPLQTEEAGFEMGLPPPVEQANLDAPGGSVAPAVAEERQAETEERPVVRPELPKDIRKVFGEDEEF